MNDVSFYPPLVCARYLVVECEDQGGVVNEDVLEMYKTVLKRFSIALSKVRHSLKLILVNVCLLRKIIVNVVSIKSTQALQTL